MYGFSFIQDLAVILLVAAAVGWLCRRAGMSAIVGYLVAGALIGPHTPPFSLVSDGSRIATAAQIGLVFLMFSIGLQLSWRRLRGVGVSLMIATVGGAVMMYYLSRLLGAALAWDTTQSLFLAAMLLVSSSTIIGKLVREADLAHERPGQLAIGYSVVEDVLAVVMLTVLNSLVHLGGDGAPDLSGTVTRLGAFVAFAAILGLLLVPWVLKRMSVSANEELQTLATAGLLLGLATLAFHAGYSLALGAFLLGTIVAETPYRREVERTFEGLRDVFSAVFFVALGMQVDLRDVAHSGWLILALSAFAIVARVATSSLALVLVGTPARDALRAGAKLTPIGEFSFIIAQLGVGAAVVPARFYPLIFGVSVLTTLMAPWLTRHSEWIAERLMGRQSRWFVDWLHAYQAWLARLEVRRQRSRLWQLSRKRIVQIGVEVLFVTGLLLFSQKILESVESWLGRDWLFPNGPEVIFWVSLSLLLLAPLIAIWRNLSALALLYSQMLTSGADRAMRGPLIETVIKAIAGGGLFVWLAAVLPAEGTARWLLLASALVAVLGLILLRRKLVYWHSQLEVGLQSAVDARPPEIGAAAAWLDGHDTWRLRVGECMIPDLADCRGRSIAELHVRRRFGCSIVGIERQGFFISMPAPATVLYPRDRVLLVGTRRQVQAGKLFLRRATGRGGPNDGFEDVHVAKLVVSAGSVATGQTLASLSTQRANPAQIAGIRRGAARLLNPGPGEVLQAGDEVLTLGTSDQLAAFRALLAAPPVAAEQ